MSKETSNSKPNPRQGRMTYYKNGIDFKRHNAKCRILRHEHNTPEMDPSDLPNYSYLIEFTKAITVNPERDSKDYHLGVSQHIRKNVYSLTLRLTREGLEALHHQLGEIIRNY